MWEYFIVNGKRPFKQFLMDRLYDLAGIAVNLIPFPQTSGFGQSMKYAGSLVDKGYSILVFPEGARTLDGSIHQFKDGVGMMAVNYKIPILPVKVSGLWETLPEASSGLRCILQRSPSALISWSRARITGKPQERSRRRLGYYEPIMKVLF